MPQSERSEILKKILTYLEKQEEEKATMEAIIHHTQWEITEGGASVSTIKKYIESLHRGGLIGYKHPFWHITGHGNKWLKRHPL